MKFSLHSNRYWIRIKIRSFFDSPLLFINFKALKRHFTILFLGLFLWGCSPLSSQFSASPQVIASEPLPQSQGQQLPIAATMTIGDDVIELEVAQSEEQQAMGLMYRTQLAPNRGMLFPFSPPRVARFWMKNTLIPLDMIFLYQGQIQAILPNVPPCHRDPCPVYGPFKEIDQVIELAEGQAKVLNLTVGDRLTIQSVNLP
jgi:uncharacterized membrane protein (UPF0127 family)